MVRPNVTLPVQGQNFQYKKTGLIPGSDSPKKGVSGFELLQALYVSDDMDPE